jgi:ribonucleoside-diphosphate reductase alpha chain
VYQPRRERLPDTRQSITHKFNVGGHEGYINVGQFPDGRPGELFITMAKEGSTVGGMMDAFGTSVSIALQYGVPLEALVNKFSHMRFEPMGHTTNPDIRIAKSVVDYIFRWMGMQYLAGFREASRGELPKGEGDETKTIAPAAPAAVAALPAPVSKAPAPAAKPTEKNGTNGTNGHHPAKPKIDLEVLERAGLSIKVDGNGPTSRNEQFARFQLDAPSCDNCGSITVRNGNCYLCHNCGNSMGCS